MSSTPFVQWNPSDWISNTRRLTLEERAIYFDLLMLIYEDKGVLEADTGRLARAIGTTRAKLDKALAMLVEQGKLTIENGMICNEKAEKIIKKIEEKSSKSRESAKARWAKEKRKTLQNQRPSDADALPSHSGRNANQEPVTSSIESYRRPVDTARESHGPPEHDDDDDQKSDLEAGPPEPEVRALLAAGGIENPLPSDLAEAGRWLTLGVAPERIRNVITGVRKRAPEPPRIASYFAAEVERLASQPPPPATPSPEEAERQRLAILEKHLRSSGRALPGLATHDRAAVLIASGSLTGWDDAIARGFDVDRSRIPRAPRPAAE